LEADHRAAKDGRLEVLVDGHLKEWDPVALALAKHGPADALKVGIIHQDELSP
jgi:hypothetical protein